MIAVFSCKTDESNQPTFPPSISLDSVGKLQGKETTSEVTVFGTITNSGKLAVDRGVVYDTLTDMPTVENTIKLVKETGAGVGNFGALMSGLKPRKLYYYRLYAKNLSGVTYSASGSVLSPPLGAKLTTAAFSNLASDSVTASGNLSNTGGEPISMKGFVFGFNGTPTLDLKGDPKMYVAIADTGTLGPYSLNITGLTPKTKYFYKAFAINRGGVSYSPDVKTFTTLPPRAVMTLNDPTITSDSISLTGTIVENKGGAISKAGFCYTIGGNPDILPASGSVVVNFPGPVAGVPFTSVVKGLAKNQTYNVRSFAVTPGGTAYSVVKTFTTLP